MISNKGTVVSHDDLRVVRDLRAIDLPSILASLQLCLASQIVLLFAIRHIAALLGPHRSRQGRRSATARIPTLCRATKRKFFVVPARENGRVRKHSARLLSESGRGWCYSQSRLHGFFFIGAYFNFMTVDLHIAFASPPSSPSRLILVARYSLVPTGVCRRTNQPSQPRRLYTSSSTPLKICDLGVIYHQKESRWSTWS